MTRFRRILPLAIAVLIFAAAGAPHVAADVFVISADPAFLAPIVDRLVNHRVEGGQHRGLIFDQPVVIPDLETPFTEQLASLAAPAGESTGKSGPARSSIIAIVPALALPGGPVPGDIQLATRIVSADGSASGTPEHELVAALRLAGADAGFFEVPDTRPEGSGERRPLIVEGSAQSVAPRAAGAQLDAQLAASGARVTDVVGFDAAMALAKTRLDWIIVEPVIGWRGKAVNERVASRTVDNVGRLVLAYLKARPPEVRKADDPSAAAGSAAPAVRGRILLRATPDPAGLIVSEFERGSKYQVLESTKGETWHHLRLDDGRQGWALAATLDREPMVVYDIATQAGHDVLYPREYDLAPHDATSANMLRAICAPDAPKFVAKELRSPPLCEGMIDSLEVAKDTLVVFFGAKSKSLFDERPAIERERFLAKLVHSVTISRLINVVRLRFTTDTPFVPRILRREDFIQFWPAQDLEWAAASHASEAMRRRAAEVLAARK